ncbi:ribosomal protein S5 domain 2-type protein, partial [Blastocladiella britannica]
MTSLVRADSRNTTSIRPFQCHHGLLHRADGSARFSAGKTNVVCGVYGPTDVRSRDEMVDRATIEVVFKQPTGLPTPREKWIEEALARALDALILTQLHPRTLIQVAVQAVQNDGA